VRLGIRSKLVAISLALIVLSLGVGYGYLRPTLDRVWTERIAADLRVRADLVAHIVEEHRAIWASPAVRPGARPWQELAVELSRRTQARITLLDRDGGPLGDSEVQSSEVEKLASHRDRPEVKEALASGHGVSMRYSATLRRRMLYVAVPFFEAGTGPGQGARIEPAGVARLAMPLDEVDRVMDRWHVAAWFGTAVALAVAVLMSSLAAHLVVGRLRQLATAARRMAHGELLPRTAPPPSPAQGASSDEVAELGRDLDQIAQSLAAALAEIVAQRDLIGGVLSAMSEGVLLAGGLAERRTVILTNPALREMLLLDDDRAGRPLSSLGNEALVAALDAADRSPGPTRHEVATAGLLPRRLLIQTRRLRADARLQRDSDRGGDRASDSDAQLLAVVVDVTELRRLETLRRDFVANASHELRTPVTALRSAAETLHDVLEADPQAAGRFLSMIERNAERLQHIIDDLLDLSRLESQTYRLEPEPIEVAEAAGRVVELFAERARARQITLKLRLPADLPQVRADRRALEHVLCNLVDNAIKYGPSGHDVVISAEAGEHELQLLVHDSGPGIPAEHLPRLFERFYRVDAGRSRALGGTGLGLAIVKHLTEAMGGQVGVESEPGRGTTFRCRLPLSRPAAPDRFDGPGELAPGTPAPAARVSAAAGAGSSG
jgi:two-component system phosphate regulon sensor histidine kinase PhoR